jgi:hypothetical protein
MILVYLETPQQDVVRDTDTGVERGMVLGVFLF